MAKSLRSMVENNNLDLETNGQNKRIQNFKQKKEITLVKKSRDSKANKF